MDQLADTLRELLAKTSLPVDSASLARSSRHGDARRMLDPAKTRLAGVLAPFTMRDGELQLWLTKRRDDLRGHPGQISFPGGGYEALDADLRTTALRESAEEINLQIGQVNVLGYLDPYLTITNYCVQPVVGLVASDFEPTPQESEVAEVFCVPAAAVLNPANQQLRRVRINGMAASYFVIQLEHRVIWGATAGMLVNLSQKLRAFSRV